MCLSWLAFYSMSLRQFSGFHSHTGILYIVGGGCDFEYGDMCTWYNSDQDDFDWEMISGGTESTGTGPLSDHTTNSSRGNLL